MGFAHGLVCWGYRQPGLWAKALPKVKAVIISLGCCLFKHRFVFPRTGALCQAFSQDYPGALSIKPIVAMELLLNPDFAFGCIHNCFMHLKVALSIVLIGIIELFF
jgi:hypothetical protein